MSIDSRPAGLRPTARGRDRQERILRAAAQLMAERGYPSVSMAQIGAEAGVVGSAVYRYFDSKAHVLAALLSRVVDTMSDGLHQAIATGATGLALLDEMILKQTEIAMSNRQFVAVYLRDSGNLDTEELRALRRQQRALVGEWINQAEVVAPDLGEAELRTVVQAVLSLINSACTYDNPLPSERLVPALVSMASATMRSGLLSATDPAKEV